jgi:bcr-type benzoyl-CoA reductase subunit C
MLGYNKVIEQLKAVLASPSKTVQDYETRTGKKAVGCFPPYTPEEIVHAAGMLPVGLWGGQVEINRARVVLPAFACSIIQSVKEFELMGKYDNLAAVLVPSPCDTLKAIGQKWSRQGVTCIQFVHPQNRKIDSARVYLRAEYQYVRERLEKVLGGKISDEALSQSIAVYNEHREAMREFSKTAARFPNIIDPVTRHLVFKSAFFMRKEEHCALVKELIDSLMFEREKAWLGFKAIVSGIMLEPNALIEVFKDLKISIIADDLAQESRQYRIDVPDDADPLNALACHWQNMYGCSLAYEKEKSRVAMLSQMKRTLGADGVIIAMMKFCDPEEFDFPLIKKEMESKNIPLLQIEVDLQAQSMEQIRTRLQSFVEINQPK